MARKKYTFLLNGREIDILLGYNFLFKRKLRNLEAKIGGKTWWSIFACKRYNKLFDTLSLPILLFSSRTSGEHMAISTPRNGKRDLNERFHAQFYKHYPGLNVVSRSEVTGKVLCQTCYRYKNPSIPHLENLPEDSIAKQCLLILTQLAENDKPSFTFSVNRIWRLYGGSGQLRRTELEREYCCEVQCWRN